MALGRDNEGEREEQEWGRKGKERGVWKGEKDSNRKGKWEGKVKREV